MAPSHLDLAVALARLLEEIEVPYVIGGSVASSRQDDVVALVDRTLSITKT